MRTIKNPAVLVLTATLALAATLFASCGVSGFNTRQWSKTDRHGYPVHRLAMWGEVENHLRTGMTRDEVTKLLGGGDTVDTELERLYTPGSRFYELGEGHVLVIQFSEEGTVDTIGSTRWPPMREPVEITHNTTE